MSIIFRIYYILIYEPSRAKTLVLNFQILVHTSTIYIAKSKFFRVFALDGSYTHIGNIQNWQNSENNQKVIIILSV